MRRDIIKVIGLALGLMLIVNTLIVLKMPNDIIVNAELSQEEVPLNLSFIHDVAAVLSNIINKTFYPQGRWFGTKGEWVAMGDVRKWMNETGLYTTRESVTNYTSPGWILSGHKRMKFDDWLQ